VGDTIENPIISHHTDSVPSRTLDRFKRWFWRRPRAHGDTILERRVSPLESLYDLVYAAVISQAALPLARLLARRRLGRGSVERQLKKSTT
jgi:hypothetical protein